MHSDIFRQVLLRAQNGQKCLMQNFEDIVDDSLIEPSGNEAAYTQIRLWLYERRYTVSPIAEEMFIDFCNWLTYQEVADVSEHPESEELSTSVASLTMSTKSLNELRSQIQENDQDLLAHFYTYDKRRSHGNKHSLAKMDVIKKNGNVLIWDTHLHQPFALITPPQLSPGLLDQKHSYFTTAN